MIPGQKDPSTEKSILVCLETDIQSDRLSDPSDAERQYSDEIEDSNAVD